MKIVIFLILFAGLGVALSSAKGLDINRINEEHNQNGTTLKMLTKHILSTDHSSQHCSFHKSSVKGAKRHIVKDNEVKGEYAHHVDIFLCSAPEGMTNSEIFDPFLREEGYSCTEKDLPFEYCKFYYEWGCPVRPPQNRYPKNAGHPIEEGEYMFMVIHYENPNNLENVEVESGFEFLYAQDEKEFDTAFLKVGRYISYKNLIPPDSTGFVVPHTCTAECTKKLPQPINIFGVTFHAHDSAMEIKLQHFRNGEIISYIAHDKHYSTNEPFKFKKLVQEVKVLPGDELRVDCTYDTTWAKGRAMLGGNSLESEMCIAFIEYYPRTKELTSCGTTASGLAIKAFFGIEEFISEEMINPIVKSPKYYTGKKLTEIVQDKNWNAESRAEFQKLLLDGPKDTYCSVPHHFE